MKIAELPTRKQCEDLMLKGEANFLEIFISIYEPQGIDQAKQWRQSLALALTRAERDAAFQAWEDGQISLSRQVGGAGRVRGRGRARN